MLVSRTPKQPFQDCLKELHRVLLTLINNSSKNSFHYVNCIYFDCTMQNLHEFDLKLTEEQKMKCCVKDWSETSD